MPWPWQPIGTNSKTRIRSNQANPIHPGNLRWQEPILPLLSEIGRLRIFQHREGYDHTAIIPIFHHSTIPSFQVMIGVIAQPEETAIVHEFFELFKTPWEFFPGYRGL